MIIQAGTARTVALTAPIFTLSKMIIMRKRIGRLAIWKLDIHPVDLRFCFKTSMFAIFKIKFACAFHL